MKANRKHRTWLVAAAAAAAIAVLACFAFAAGAVSDQCPQCMSRDAIGLSTQDRTCTQDMTATYRCADCGYVWTAVLAKATGHEFGDWEVIREATCTEPGERRHTCRVTRPMCGYSETEPIEITPHMLVWKQGTAPTCTEDGQIDVWQCSECEAMYADSDAKDRVTNRTLSASGHEWQDEITPPTCIEAGYTTKVCASCGETGETIPGSPAAGHVLAKHEGSAATCTEAGVRDVWECSVCGGRYLDREAAKEAKGPDTIEPLGHSLVHAASALASCTEKGTREHWTCTRCGLLFEDAQGLKELEGSPDIAPSGHNLRHVPGKNPGCETDGSLEYWECTECGKLFLDEGASKQVSYEDTNISAPGHTLEHVPEKAPTEDAEGCAEHWKCTACGKLFGDSRGTQEMRPEDVYESPYGHTLVLVERKAPACMEPGMEEHYECSGCGALFRDADGMDAAFADELQIAPTGHDFSSAVKAPTCEEAGYTEHTCRTCGTVIRDTETDATGHSTVFVPEVPAAHDTKGVRSHWTCSVCGAVFEDAEARMPATDLTVPALGHGWKDETIPPTCEEPGYTKHTCTVCGETYRDSEGDPAGHSTTHVPEVPPTADEPGMEAHWECTSCGAWFSDEQGSRPVSKEDLTIPPTGHNYEDITVEATCTEGGYTDHVCRDERCTSTYRDGETDPLGHALTRHPAQSPTLTRAGNIEYWECTRCGALFADSRGMQQISINDVLLLPTKGQYEQEVVEPTCTAPGYTINIPIGDPDSKVFLSDWTDPVGHKMSMVPYKEATETEDGRLAYGICEKCGGKYQSESAVNPLTDDDIIIRAHAHRFTQTSTAATCTEPARMLRTCTVCQHETASETGPHSDTRWRR